MKTFAAIAFTAALLGFSATTAQAGFNPGSFMMIEPQAVETSKVVATVSISQQTMYLDVTDDAGLTQTYVWKVSTGKRGYETPTGAWSPTWLSKNHRSKTYDNAPMPFAVFFTGGYAVHSTDAVNRLGKPASHGCVRLSPDHAAAFFKLVSTYGKENTRIVITD